MRNVHPLINPAYGNMICAGSVYRVHIQHRNHELDHADRTIPTRQHELDHTDLPEILHHEGGIDDLLDGCHH